MKKFYYLMTALAVAFGMSACQDPVEPEKPEPEPEKEAVAPTADFDFTVDGLVVSFTNKSQNATSYKWDFGDDETSKEQNPKHEFASAGDYTVVLTAANAAGQTSKKEAKLTVAGKAEAYFSFAVVEGRAGEFGKNIAFDATSSANAASIVWDFGDGSSSTDFTVNHTFPAFQTYTVKATVTGLGGDKSEFSQDVEIVKNTNLIQGGSMEEDDAQFWTVAPFWGYDAGQYADVEGVYAYAPAWGVQEAGFGKGGCYRFTSNPLGWDYNNKGAVYQSFEVREGDVIEVDCQVKWGAETFDNGNFSVRVSYDEFSVENAAILFWFNSWWGVHDPNPEDPNDYRYTVWAPAYQGGFEGNEEQAEYGFGVGEGELVDGKLRFTATKTGTAFLSFYVNQVWGFAFGAGKDVYLDEVTVNAVVD